MARRQKAYNYTRRIKKTFLFNAGADSDTNPMLASLREGKYRDAINMRLNADGGKEGLTKILGEDGIYEGTIDTDLTALGATPGFYTCLGSEFVDSYHVAFFGTLVGSPQHACIAINGRVVLFSADFPLNGNYPVQIDVNETGYGGEIFINDKHVRPMIFNVYDLVTEWNAGVPTTKYFADFDINNHIVQIDTPMDQPVFMRLENTGGVTGLPAGGYSYSIRYVDDDGNGTSWGPSTPIIPVVGNVNTEGTVYKGALTHGRIPDPTVNTRYGIRLRMRVTNSGDFAYMELRRVASIEGQSLSTQPQPQKLILSTINIRKSPYAVIDFVDTSDNNWEDLDDFSNEEIAVIDTANAIKYYNNRLTLHGPTYKTKVISDTDLFLTTERDSIGFAFIGSLGDIGFNDIWNQVYRKSYMHGERYGWAILCHDGTGGRAFAVPCKDLTVGGDSDFTNYKIPNRRASLGLDTMELSEGYVTCADVSSRTGASVGGTHEVMDNEGTQTKDNASLINCLDNDTYNATFSPFMPTGDRSSTFRKYDVSGHNTLITNKVRYDATHYYTFAGDYNPQGWGHGIYSQGIAFQGIDTTKLPSHIKSFSVVRTKPAGRVLCQGIGFYALNEQTNPDPVDKYLNKIWFYSPDIDQNIGLNPQLFDDIISNPSSYQVQLVSPVGFFSEVFSGMTVMASYGAYVDIMSYAKILYDNNKFNYGDGLNIGRGDGYVSFGRWRNIAGGATGVESDTSEEFIFNISGAGQNIIDGHEGRSTYLELSIATAVGDTNIYLNSSVTGGNQDFDHAEMKAYHEPLYIINIINNNAQVPSPNITEYIDTGFHQKLRSIVGFSNGETIQQYDLVDERWEDCMWGTHFVSTGSHTGANGAAVLTDSNAGWVVNALAGYLIWNITDGSAAVIVSNTANTATGTLADGTDNDWDTGDVYQIRCNKYVYVDGKAWWALPNNNGFPGLYDACMTALDAGGVWDDGNRNIYGVCLCYSVAGEGGLSDKGIIDFNQAALDALYPATTGYAASFYVPAEDDKIEVRYDNRAPLVVFGGDTFIGDALFVPIDSTSSPARALIEASSYSFNIGFPYYEYELAYIFQSYFAEGYDDWFSAGNKAVGAMEDIRLNYLRQLAVLFTCESRINLPLMMNDSFPKKNYVQRPLRINFTQWDNGAGAMSELHGLSKEYEEEYGDEYLTWRYGGFHFPGSSNIDYSKALIDRVSYSKPIVGFDERLYYPDRSIWSVLRKNPAEFDSLKVFPVLNVFDGSDLSGPIRYAWAANTGKGDNIYKVTDRGVCILLLDKNILTDLTGGEIGIIGSSEAYIQAEYWLSRDVGMNDEMWRSAAWVGNNLFFANTESVYWLANNELKDIGILDYHKVLYDMFDTISYKGAGYTTGLAGVINLKNEEYWLHVDPVTGSAYQAVFNYRLGTWVGRFRYSAGMICSDKYRVYSVYGTDVLQLGYGQEILGANFECSATIAINPALGAVCQFKKIEIFSSAEPTSVLFSDVEPFVTQATLSSATKGTYYLKDKGSYQNKIPRKTTGGERFNKPVLYVKITQTSNDVFTLSSINIVANQLKS